MDWCNEVRRASTISAVLVMVNEYIEQLPMAQGIPQEFRPLAVRRFEDVDRWQTLISSGLESSICPSVAFQELGAVFSLASARLHELAPGWHGTLDIPVVPVSLAPRRDTTWSPLTR